MAHKIWTGSINFGLVAIPVGLYSATEDHSISFHQYERDTTDRVRYRRVNERTGKEVSFDDVVKGREVDGALITVEPKELEEIAPGRSRTIDITSFVDLDEIDPVFFQKTYWIAPAAKEQDRPYHLLRDAMAETNRVGIATFVMRGREYLTALRADRSALALDTLFFADEIRDPGELLTRETPAREGSAAERELSMATGLIESMSASWQPEEYSDTYTERVEQLLRDKAEGREPQVEPAPQQSKDVIDLTDALRRSVDQARSGRRSGSRQQTKESTADLGDLTKTQLERRAKELGIRGRSRMSRDELAEAVSAASTDRGHRKVS